MRSEVANLVQGVNVLVNWAGRVYADNTDGKGCVSYLERCGAQFQGMQVAICGTGPTSLSIMHACASAGASRVCLLGRDLARARNVLDGYLNRAAPTERGNPFVAFAYDRAGLEALGESSVIIDATSLGMKPGDPAPFDTGVLHAGQTVLDVVYGHGRTALIAAAEEAGCVAHDGAGMLVAQAVETVRDIAEVTGSFSIPSHMDLFAIMASAAGFDLR